MKLISTVTFAIALWTSCSAVASDMVACHQHTDTITENSVDGPENFVALQQTPSLLTPIFSFFDYNCRDHLERVSSGCRYDYDIDTQSDSVAHFDTLGLYIQLGLGTSDLSLISQSPPDGPNFIGGGIGYCAKPWLYVLATVDLSGYAYASFDSTKNRFDVGATMYAAELRLRPYGGLFLSAGLGRIHVTGSSKYFTAMQGANGDSLLSSFKEFSQNMWEVHAGLGYGGSLGIIELRLAFGLNRFDPIGATVSQFNMVTIKYGFNFWM